MRKMIADATGSLDRVLVCIFLLALCVRLVHAVFFIGLEVIPPGDFPDFFAYADNLVAGQGFQAWGYRAFRAPGYPVFLASIFYFFGRYYPVVKIIQCLISSLIPVLVCLIGLKITSRKTAVLAGVYACFYYGLVLEPSTIMTEAIFTFLFTLTVFLFLRARENIVWGIAAGLSLAMMTLTRPVGLVALPFFFAWLYYVLDRRTFAKTAVVIAAVAVAAMAPWWVRNYRLYHAFVPVCLETGEVMVNLHIPPEKRTIARYKYLPEYEKDRLKTSDALAYLKQQGTVSFVKGGLQRLATFFYPFLPAYDITWAFMCPFWLLGMYVMVKQGNKQAYILFLHFIYFPIYFFFCATTRFKYSVSQFMILFAAAGFFYLYEKYRSNGKFYAALIGWTVANLVVWLNAPFFRAFALKFKGS